MKNKDRLEKLFSLFYNQNASSEEIDEFFRLIEDVSDQELETLANKHFEAGSKKELLFPAQLRDKLYAKITDTGRIRPPVVTGGESLTRHIIRLGWAAAVIAAMGVGIWWYFRMDHRSRAEMLADAASMYQGYLMDTTSVQVHGVADTVLSASSESIIKVAELARQIGRNDGFSTITVPYGKRSEILLPDGSKVWLNAGSQLTFANVFEDKGYEVFLIGEGYFEVSKRKTHPFYVRTVDMNIKVMGTSFNVSAYPDDDYTAAVLLSGKIEIEATSELDFQNIAIEPGTSATLNRTDKKLKVQQVAAEDEVSWTKRRMILKKTRLSEILTRLGRIYNADIVDDFGRDSAETFSGQLDLTKPLIDVLKAVCDPNEGYQINQVEGRYIIIK